MLVVAALLAYAACTGWAGDRLLARVTPRCGSPAAALRIWHGLALSVLTSIGIALALMAHDVWEHSLTWLLHADKSRVHAAYAGPQEVPTAWNLALVILLVIGVAGLGSAFANLRRIQRTRTSHRLLPEHNLTPPDRTHNANSLDAAFVAVVREPAPMIYCLPGKGSTGRIVVTTGARDLLSDDQLQAAVEHERAHLACGHHRIVLIAEAVAAAFRLPRLLQHYPSAVRLLVELEADDVAASLHRPHTVASALLELSCGAVRGPQVGLAMTGTGTTIRIRRLLNHRHRVQRRGAPSMHLVVAVILATAPASATVMPALSLAGSAHWPEDSAPAGPQRSESFVHHP